VQVTEQRATFIARVGPESRASVGDHAELQVDTRKLYFFDPASGRSLGVDRGTPSAQTAGAVAD
jgi:hypothetical protein